MYGFHSIGTTINQKYRLVNVLGKGGWGVTYLAEDLSHSRQVAIKALTLNGLSDWKQIELFEREATVLQSLKHSAIPEYLEYFTADTADNRCFYLVQELAPGKSLANWIKDGWRPSEKEVKHIARQLLAILIYLHAHKPPIIHRDLKPDNIIRQENNKIFLVDFGAVKNTYYSTIARSSTVVGTFGYIAPEQFIGQAKPASDLYGLGATILYLLTHVSPAELSTDSLQIKFRDRTNISDDFADWLETMVEPEIENRFEDAKTALTVLDGKQNNPLKINSIPPSTLKITAQGIGLVLVIVAYFFKWGILSRLGIVPEDICSPQTMTKYLKQGGDPNAWRNDFDYSFPIVKCFAKIEDQKTLDLFTKKGGNIYQNYWGDTVWEEVRSLDSALILFKHLQQDSKISRKKRQKITFLLINKPEDIAIPLIEQGANTKARDRFGNTILHQTTSRHIALLAIEKGIDVNVKNNYGNTPLHHRKSLEVVELLLEQGANVNEQNKKGQTVLHLAHLSKDILIAKVLISSEASINLKDNAGKTPLHMAVLNKTQNSSYLKLLLESGADINLKDNEGKTPLDYARATKKQELIDLLTSYSLNE